MIMMSSHYRNCAIEASTHQKEWGAKLFRELSIFGTGRILDL